MLYGYTWGGGGTSSGLSEKAHVVGGELADWRRPALLIRNAGALGEDITVYEADAELGGGRFLQGTPQSGYNLRLRQGVPLRLRHSLDDTERNRSKDFREGSILQLQ
jgi:hypothetical protein